jgi:phage-related protein
MRQVIQLDAFRREIAEWPPETREDLFSLIDRYLCGERLNRDDFKTFQIDRRTKIQGFKVKDHRGNWRAISCLQVEFLVLIHAFHKKTVQLSEKEKRTIQHRVRGIR